MSAPIITQPYTPVTSVLTVINVLVYLYYAGQPVDIQAICGKDVISIIKQMFTHLDLTHILVNMVSLKNLSGLESGLGSSGFTKLVLIITFLNMAMTYLIDKITPLTCSIGFSGIIFGLYMYAYFKTKELTLMTIVAAFSFVLQPSMINPKVSLIGHSIGALSGFLIARFINI